MRDILNVFIKEVIHLKRDKRIFPILFFAPIFQVILLGLAATLDVKKIPLVVLKGGDRSSRLKFEGITSSSEYFVFVGEVLSYEEGIELMKEGSIEAILNLTTPPEVIIDATNSNNAIIIASYISRLLNQDFPSETTLSFTPELSMHILYNEKLTSRNFLVPGIFGAILLVMTMVLTALSIVRERERGTIESIVTTPLSRSAFIIGKLTPYVIIGLIDATLILLIAVFVLRVPFRGSLIVFFLFCLLYTLNTLGGGIFFSIISRTEQQAMMSIFIIMLPLIILSGFVFPVENMPVPFQIIARFDPLFYFLHAIRCIFLKGLSIKYLITDAIVLALTGTLILILSIKLFRKNVG